METAAIGYRVVDFLKKYPPFQAIDEADLLALTADGRVKFYQANDYVLWQGEPHKLHVFVIQQGSVSLWDDTGAGAVLRDVRGEGDLLGVERFNGARSVPLSAKAQNDVLIYAFPESDFDALVLKYPHAREYIAAYSGAIGYKATEERRDPLHLFLHDAVAERRLVSCDAADSIREAVHRMIEAGAEAIAVFDAARAPSVVTAAGVLEWIAAGGGDVEGSVSALVHGSTDAVGADATVADGTLILATSGTGALALTADGTPEGPLQAIITPRDLAPIFGDQPIWILQQIARADNFWQLRALNHRARAFILRHLSGPASVDWLARFARAVDSGILARLIALDDALDDVSRRRACWCAGGAAGRGESLTLLAPHLIVIVDDDEAREPLLEAYERVAKALGDCGYLPGETPFAPAFNVASLDEWQSRYRAWVRDPVLTEMYRARPLFDLRAIVGDQSLWRRAHVAMIELIDPMFLHVLANDCLARMPPLTFFHDAVVEESGEQTAVFRLEQSVLRPLVDVGRVFGVAARSVFGCSTLERLATARALLPEFEAIFRESSETFRIVLWQQARVGIGQGTSGFELPPSLLSRHDRQILKSGFRSILRLLEFTAESAWMDQL